MLWSANLGRLDARGIALSHVVFNHIGGLDLIGADWY